MTLINQKNPTLIVTRDNEPDLRFTGIEIAYESSKKPDGPSSSRWTEITLYRTDSGKYVVERRALTIHQGESDKHEGFVCDDHQGIIDVLGHGWVSKSIYDQAGIDAVEDI